MPRPDRYSLNGWDRGLGDVHDAEEVSFYLCADVVTLVSSIELTSP
jgi:hypothetical protein